MQKVEKAVKLLAVAVGAAGLVLAAGCTPLIAGQMAEAGYHAAKTTLGGDTSTAADARQKKLQLALNSIEIGQEVKPILDSMGEPPQEKSGNTYGFICYEYAAVYSATDSAVIVAKEDKVVFYGNSRCNVEMQDANFKKDGKYAASAISTPSPSPSAGGGS
ncbi:MAG: hypothetical protein ABI228_06005 [Burkholderiaceae bacterium]